MKTTIKQKTLKSILTKSGQVNQNIINAIKHCNFAKGKIYTGYYSGSGRYTTAHSASDTITTLLDLNGYKWKMGNDAPRGGISGEHLIVSTKAILFLLEIFNYNNYNS